MSVNPAEMPRLGFGLMRLPTADGAVDLRRLCEMVDLYMESGFSYYDTAYGYHGGQSESAVREAVVGRYPRDSFSLATKMPSWEIKSAEACERVFSTQLERTGAGYFDYYLLHSVEDGARYENCVKYGFEWGSRKKEEGKIRHFGFSFHGSPDLLERILSEHPEMEFAQIQLNYADWENPIVHSGKLYEILRRHETPMIVMEPVKGGMLAALPPEIAGLMTGARPGRSLASWALRFAASLEGVATVLSGMSDREQMRDNIETMTRFEPITEEERAVLDRVVQAVTAMPTIPCTECRYCCDGCPAGIRIPDIFRALNTLRMYGEDARPHFFYRNLAGGRAKACEKCGRCEGACPQRLKIMELLEEASSRLDAAR